MTDISGAIDKAFQSAIISVFNYLLPLFNDFFNLLPNTIKVIIICLVIGFFIVIIFQICIGIDSLRSNLGCIKFLNKGELTELKNINRSIKELTEKIIVITDVKREVLDIEIEAETLQ